jgi:hypothetical protein
MRLECLCGYMMADTGQPNDVEHLLISCRSMERLQDLADEEVKKDGIIDMWPEHWEQSGASEIWKCLKCNRLYFNPKGPRTQIMVYAIEKTGI